MRGASLLPLCLCRAMKKTFLLPRGMRLTRIFVQELRQEARSLSYELIIVSPLIRTLQTASLGFPSDGDRPGGGGVKMLAYESVRERFGRNPCDSRNTKEVLAKEFAHVDFSLIEDGPDPHMCNATICPVREEPEDIDARVCATIPDKPWSPSDLSGT